MTKLEHGLRIGDLISSRVIDADGRNLGKVVDVRVSADGRYQMLELLVGSSGWLDRLNLERLFRGTDIREPDRILWHRVDRFENARIYLKAPADSGETG